MSPDIITRPQGAEVTPSQPSSLLIAVSILLLLSGDGHSCAKVLLLFTFLSSFNPCPEKDSYKHITWQMCYIIHTAQPGRIWPSSAGCVSGLSLGREGLPVLRLGELHANSQAEQLEEIWWKPHCLVHGMWFTPPRLWILICYIRLLNSAFLLPFLRMKSRLFSAQSKNQPVIKFSFSFSFEAFMPLKLIYMLYILNKV